MMGTRRKIDFSKIWLSIHTNEKDADVEEWIKAGKKNQTFFADAESFYQDGSSLNRIPVDSQKSLRQIKGRLKRKRYIRFSSSVAAMVAIVVSVYFLLNWTGNPEMATNNNEFTPGEHKATLVLNDGKEIDLDLNKVIDVKEKGANIKCDGRTVEYQVQRKKKKRKNNKQIINTLKVPRGGMFFVRLSDSTKVWLNAQSELKYPVRFRDNVREVTLVGEAFFEVTRNEKVPFIVKTKGQKIRVLGTAFNVAAYADESFVQTTLVEGKVEVQVEGNKLALEPSFQSVYNVQNKNLLKTEVNVEFFTAWKDGTFYFDNERLDNILKTLSRWYDFDFEFENESAASQCFTGSFARDQKLENIILIIEQTQRIKITAYGKKLMIE